MIVINNPANPEGNIWVLGRGRGEPEEQLKNFSNELSKLLQGTINENKTFTQDQLGFEARIAVSGIPLYLDKENYRQGLISWWGMVREPPTEKDNGPFLGLGSSLSGKQTIWYSRRNWTWVLASPQEMAKFSFEYLSKTGLI